MENILFDSYKSKNLDLKNRIVMAPMTRSRSDNPEHKATELTAKYYQQRATAGLIITEGTLSVRKLSASSMFPQFTMMHKSKAGN